MTQRIVAINVRRQPTLKPFGVEYAAVNRVIVTHRGERVRKAALECQVEIGPRYSVNRKLKRFPPRDPGETLDGIGPILYPPRPSTAPFPK